MTRRPIASLDTRSGCLCRIVGSIALGFLDAQVDHGQGRFVLRVLHLMFMAVLLAYALCTGAADGNYIRLQLESA